MTWSSEAACFIEADRADETTAILDTLARIEAELTDVRTQLELQQR
jgi:hypothetical protein